MHIDFYDQHCETLYELIQMAKKHQCVIKFGFRNDGGDDLDSDILMENGFSRELAEEFLDTIDVRDVNCNYSCIWFELYDTRDKKHHNLEYSDNYTYFYFDDTYDSDAISQELVDLIDEIKSEYAPGFIQLRGGGTKIFNFSEESKGTWVETNEVYRSGMVLKFFGDYVCDYLGEERIVRVY